MGHVQYVKLPESISMIIAFPLVQCNRLEREKYIDGSIWKNNKNCQTKYKNIESG